jgi:hypothetical protein
LTLEQLVAGRPDWCGRDHKADVTADKADGAKKHADAN